MTGELIIALVTGVALLDLFRLRSQRAHFSRAGLLVASIARAMLPVAVALTFGTWSLIRAFEEVARTGHGGVLRVAGPNILLLRSLMAGVIAFAVILAVAWVLAARTGRNESDADMGGGSRRTVAATTGAIALALVMGGTWIAMNAADKFAVGIIASITGRTGVVAPAGAPPPPRFPPPPRAYAAYAAMSGMEMATQSERLITSRISGLVGAGLLIGMCLLTSRLFSRAWVSRASWTFARAAVVALIAGASWYAVQLGTGVGWLRSVIAG